MNALTPVQPDRDRSAQYIEPALEEAWAQSGIPSEDGDSSWFFIQRGPEDFVPRLQQIMLYADKAHGGGKKEFGPRLSLTHELRGAHRAFNFENAEKYGLTPILLAFAFAAHDIVENKRARAEKLVRLKIESEGRPFMAADAAEAFTARDAEKVYAEISRILDDPFAFGQVRQSCLYMTDPPGSVTGTARITAQIDKTFGADGTCLVGPMEQVLRAIDKWEQVTGDRWARENGYLPDDKLEAQIKKAQQKMRFLEAPAVRDNLAFVKEYKDALSYLESEWQQVQASRAAAPTVVAFPATGENVTGTNFPSRRTRTWAALCRFAASVAF
jgi:hypothetical protein